MQLLSGDNVKTTYYDNFFETLEHKSLKDFLLAYSNDRTENLHFDYSARTHYVQAGPSSFSLDLDLTVRVPEHMIKYQPRFWQLIKFAWVKYFAVLLFTWFLLHRLFLNYVMTSGKIFETAEVLYQFRLK